MVCYGGKGGSCHQLILITLGRPQLLNSEVCSICWFEFLNTKITRMRNDCRWKGRERDGNSGHVGE